MTTLVLNPSPFITYTPNSICLGVMTKPTNDWHLPGGEIPDGNFALFRSNEEKIEFISDTIGTRTVWYYLDDEKFIASSSQRAIISILGSFEPNPETYTWFLASGYHGPKMSWDKRIQCLDVNQSSISLSFSDWEFESKVNPIVFTPDEKPRKDFYTDFQEDLEKILNEAEIDHSKWAMGISGGTDSRAILSLFKKPSLRAITWGLEWSSKEPQNDVVIGKKVAEELGFDHSFYSIDDFPIPFPEIIERFLYVGEGRVDKFAGYVDGFHFWLKLQKDQIWGIIRGEIPSSQHSFAYTVQDAYDRAGYHDLSDEFPPEIIESWGLIPQKFPEEFLIREGESAMAYQGRINHGFRIPTYHGGLNDLKTGFVEVLQPLLLNETIQRFRRIPDEFRTHKLLLRKIVENLGPKVRFATQDSLEKYSSILRRPEVTLSIIKTLSQPNAKEILSENLLNFLLLHLDCTGDNSGMKNSKAIKKILKENLPQKVIRALKKLKPSSSSGKKKDIHIIAFRAFIIIKMNEILAEAANSKPFSIQSKIEKKEAVKKSNY